MISVGGKVTGSVLIDESGSAAVDDAEIGADVAAAFAGQNGGQNGVNSGVEGVTVPAPTKRKASLWQKGQSGNPSGLRKFAGTIIRAIQADSPPERIIAMLNEMEDIAREYNSWRGLEAVIRLRLEYTEGKPIQRTHTVTSKMDNYLNILESGRVVDVSSLVEAGDEAD
jgi:hypothetical protein